MVKLVGMKKILFIFLLLISAQLFAHNIDYGKIILRQWVVLKENKTFEGSLYIFKNNEVYIEDAQNNIIHYPIHSFSKEDQEYVFKRYSKIAKLNYQLSEVKNESIHSHLNFRFWIICLLLSALAIVAFRFTEKNKQKYLSPIFFVGVAMLLYGFTDKKMRQALLTTTDPLFLDSAFSPFKPKIYTHWDNTYFYVESKGIPDHEMMIGITGWQQQVPIPQCYTTANNNNAWSIPLNPVVASTTIPVDTIHFTRGAIALAVNGIPIFNYHTNTGVDSYLDGQLDNYGGHCGRADDYHYHIAPLVLYNQIAGNKPVAFALDGFAIYGAQEPDGTPMTTLDINHGHYGTNGVYHYHGTPPSQGAPYMIGNMVGVVNEDATHQIIPQPTAKSPRPALTPLTGAVITHCLPNSNNNGYNLTYTRAGQAYAVNYYWADTTNGRSKYIFDFVSPTGTTQSIYVGSPSQSSCNVPTVAPPVNGTIKKTMKRLPDTGETLGYTTTYGEDNDINIFPPYFLNNGDGTVTDTITGLMWQKIDGGSLTFENALVYCDTLSLAGYTDWRLPSPREGFSIMNLQNNNPALDPIFGNSGAEYWWTISRQVNDTTKVWCTNAGGGVGNKPKSEAIGTAAGTHKYNVRAVRDVVTPSTISNRFTNNGDGTILDNLTNLVWQRVPYTDSVTWENALVYADSLTLAGYIDWRLPNIKELQSITDEQLVNPGVDTSFFKVLNNKKYWSSSSMQRKDSVKAWYLQTQYGITTYDFKTARDLLLCVRGSSNVSNNYIFNGNGSWDKIFNWLYYTIPPTTLPANYGIIIDPIISGQCNLNITQTISPGATITVNPGKTFVIPGVLIQQ